MGLGIERQGVSKRGSAFEGWRERCGVGGSDKDMACCERVFGRDHALECRCNLGEKATDLVLMLFCKEMGREVSFK